MWHRPIPDPCLACPCPPYGSLSGKVHPKFRCSELLLGLGISSRGGLCRTIDLVMSVTNLDRYRVMDFARERSTIDSKKHLMNEDCSEQSKGQGLQWMSREWMSRVLRCFNLSTSYGKALCMIPFLAVLTSSSSLILSLGEFFLSQVEHAWSAPRSFQDWF